MKISIFGLLNRDKSVSVSIIDERLPNPRVGKQMSIHSLTNQSVIDSTGVAFLYSWNRDLLCVGKDVLKHGSRKKLFRNLVIEPF